MAPFTDGESVFNPDSWDGYRENRRKLLDHIEREEIDNVVFLTGDVHSSWAFDIPPTSESGELYDPVSGAGSCAVEFVTPAVSSPSIASYASKSPLLDGIEERLSHLRYMNLEDHGFVILDLTPERARAEFVFTDPVKERSRRTRCGPVLQTLSGVNHLTRLDSVTCVG